MRYYPVTNKSRLYVANSVRDPDATATTRLKHRVRRKKSFIQIRSKKVPWIQLWQNYGAWYTISWEKRQKGPACHVGRIPTKKFVWRFSFIKPPNKMKNLSEGLRNEKILANRKTMKSLMSNQRWVVYFSFFYYLTSQHELWFHLI